MAIGCERCHGPGELHVKERNLGLPMADGGDDSIVNPRHLARATQEDICAQCHLSAFANVTVRGRSKTDFRPGMRMADFAVSYRVDRPNSAMTVSGQIQQMRLSRCYRESQTMTCTTCHDLHAPANHLAKADHYRNKCLSCHQTASCKQAMPARKTQEDNCIACHMPRGPTDIPHLSFTHHRIGIHRAKPTERLSELDQLVPTADLAHLPEHERQRLLGLANDIFAGKLAGGLDDETRYDPVHQALAKVFQERARRLLEEVRSRGLRDAEVEDFFSRLYRRRDAERCIAHADATLQATLQALPIAPAIRKSALLNLATSHFDQGRYEIAFPYLEELVQCERSEISLMLLAICQQKKGNLSGAVRLINEAIAASPDRADLHEFLASVYRGMGRAADAEAHVRRAKLLRLKVPQPG
jgi:hypothetical protein